MFGCGVMLMYCSVEGKKWKHAEVFITIPDIMCQKQTGGWMDCVEWNVPITKFDDKEPIIEGPGSPTWPW